MKQIVMKETVLIWILAILAMAPVFALASGPSDGGGTNLTIGEEELTDLLKFRKEYGDKQFLIEPKKFHLKGQTDSIHSMVKPLLDRMIYFFPPMEKSITDAFEKPWIVVNAQFRPRNSQEKKVVAQTADAIFVSLPWLKTATAETLKIVWIHEAMRNFSIRFDTFSDRYVGESTAYNQDENSLTAEEKDTLKKKRDAFWARLPEMKTKAMDLIAEELTPFVYAGFPYSIIKQTMADIATKISADVYDNAIDYLNGMVLVGNREEVYDSLKGVKLGKLFGKACDSVSEKSSPGSFRDLGQIADNLIAIQASTYDYFDPSIVKRPVPREPMRRRILQEDSPLRFSGIVYDRSAALEPSIRLYASILNGLKGISGSRSEWTLDKDEINGMLMLCRKGTANSSFVQEFEADEGSIKDPYKAPTHDEIPEGMRRILKKL